MPYLKPEKRPQFNPVIALMVIKGVRPDENLKDILFEFCKLHVVPSYNNFKNFRGELKESADEIVRRHKEFTGPLWPPLILKGVKNEESRKEIIQRMKDVGVKADGDLNYILFSFCRYHVPNWKKFCRILRQCHREIGEKLLAPYEDEKIKENGDV